MKCRVSIIMPIYNAEKELEETIKSIINQSIGFDNIELILVDDASKDNSKKIIDKYSQQYENIISYYSKNNHGYPGFGRNKGLELATTDYIMFIDNDDKYDKDICKNLYETIIAENADMVCCGKIVSDEISDIKEKINYVNGIENNEKVIIEGENVLLFDSYVVWNKIFKNEIIKSNRIKFYEDTRLDDRKFTSEYYLHTKKIVFLKDYYGYYWKINSQSLSHENREEHMDDMIDCIRHEYYLLKRKNKEQIMNIRAKTALIGPIIECSYLKVEKDRFKDNLQKIHDLEKEIEFKGNLNIPWANIINKLIIHKHYTITINLLRTLDILRKSSIIKKINRKLK